MTTPNADHGRVIVPTDITCTWCGSVAEIRDGPFYGLWLYCTNPVCEWAVTVRVAPGDAPSNGRSEP
jgi:hypothetical protein